MHPSHRHHGRRAAMIAGVACSMLATAGFAQAPPQGDRPDGHGERHGMRGHHRDPAAHAQHLRDALQLRGDQESALQAFLGSMKPPEGARDGRRGDREEMQSLTTPQRLERQAARMAEHQARFAQHAEATKRFYAALTPAQQKAFDALHKGRGGMMGRHHRGGGRG